MRSMLLVQYSFEASHRWLFCLEPCRLLQLPCLLPLLLLLPRLGLGCLWPVCRPCYCCCSLLLLFCLLLAA